MIHRTSTEHPLPQKSVMPEAIDPQKASIQTDVLTRIPLPSWRVNLFIFGVPILIALSYALWQIHVSKRTFAIHTTEHSQLVAGVIELQAKSAYMTQDVINEIVETYLGNMARFVAYLHGIEPFSPEELTAFSLESGLSGIRIVEEGKLQVEGPAGWTSVSGICGNVDEKLQHLKHEGLYLFPWRDPKADRCILVGLPAGRIEALQSQISLDYLLSTLGKMPGIRYVRMEPLASLEALPGVSIRETSDLSTAEVRLPMRDQVLVVGSDTRFFLLRIQQIWRDFSIFAGILLTIGVLLSLILHRYQKRLLSRVRAIDRAMAREQQDATLGRSAAAIAHEIRNPLNAMDMGLQRLQMEAPQLEPEQRDLIDTLREAVSRTNGIVSDLKRFAQPLAIEKRPVRLDLLIGNILALYEPILSNHHIQVYPRITCTQPVAGADELLASAVENLVKNALEAQPAGGEIGIEWTRTSADVGLLAIENPGFTLPETEAQKILEPYFSRKARGTGLGLPTTVKIVSAHGGTLWVMPLGGERLRIEIRLPLLPAGHRSVSSQGEDGQGSLDATGQKSTP
jgi:two-component system, NtrC family, sensor histidine kinase HydH